MLKDEHEAKARRKAALKTAAVTTGALAIPTTAGILAWKNPAARATIRRLVGNAEKEGAQAVSHAAPSATPAAAKNLQKEAAKHWSQNPKPSKETRQQAAYNASEKGGLPGVRKQLADIEHKVRSKQPITTEEAKLRKSYIAS